MFIDKDGVMRLIEEKGLTAHSMEVPAVKVNGERWRYARPYRYYSLKSMHTALDNLKLNGVKTIWVYVVRAISDVWNQEDKEPDGVYVRWNYHAGE